MLYLTLIETVFSTLTGNMLEECVLDQKGAMFVGKIAVFLCVSFLITNHIAHAATCTSALLPGNGDDLEITGPCTVAAGTYNYGNVNIYNGGSLTFADAEIDFWAKSVLIENNGSLIAGSPQDPIGENGGSLTIHLYGTDQGIGGSGVSCKTDEMCGIPLSIWQTNGSTKVGLSFLTVTCKKAGYLHTSFSAYNQ